MLICCKNKKITNVDMWLLEDYNGFTSRKLLYGICPVCRRSVVTLIQKRISDGKLFKTENITGLAAIKTIYREKKRLRIKLTKVKSSDLFGFVYGVNKEIKNKKNEVTQVRQYRCDIKSNTKELSKVINLKLKNS